MSVSNVFYIAFLFALYYSFNKADRLPYVSLLRPGNYFSCVTLRL